MKLNNKKGFTIVELVIVIAVIAILAGVLIPTFSTVIENANRSAALQEAKTAMEIVAMEENASLSGNYYVVTGKYVFVYEADGKGITETKPADFTKKSFGTEYAASTFQAKITLDKQEKGYTQQSIAKAIAEEGAPASGDNKAVYYAASAKDAFDVTKVVKETSKNKATKDLKPDDYDSFVVTYTPATTEPEAAEKYEGAELTTNPDISTNVIVIGFKPVVA